jgi:hypothetical protein
MNYEIDIFEVSANRASGDIIIMSRSTKLCVIQYSKD